jgi:hypothetical protein
MSERQIEIGTVWYRVVLTTIAVRDLPGSLYKASGLCAEKPLGPASRMWSGHAAGHKLEILNKAGRKRVVLLEIVVAAGPSVHRVEGLRAHAVQHRTQGSSDEFRRASART